MVLCAYGRSGRRPTSGSDTSGVNDLGVLVVDSRDGGVKHTVRFPGASKEEYVVWMSQGRGGVDERDDADEKDSRMVTCVTSAGVLWRFRVSLGGDEVEEAVRSDALLEGLGSEDSPMEDLVLAMDAMVVEGRGTKHSAKPAEAKGVTEDSTTTLPAFVTENGYRGSREGYTYWEGTPEGEHMAGYYRNDVMRDMLAAQRERERDFEAGTSNSSADDISNIITPLSTSSDSLRNKRKKLLRCFLHLPASSKFVACSQEPEDGMLTVGNLALTTESMSMSNIEGLIGHLSGVLVLAASPDESVLASGSYDETIRIYDTATWKCIKILKGHGGGIKCLNFSDDGSQLFSAASDNTTRVWSTVTWMCMRQLHGRHEDATWPVAQSLHTINEPSNSSVPSGPTGPSGPNGSITTTPMTATSSSKTTKLLVSGSNGLFGGSTLKLFDVTSGNCLATFAQLRYDHKGSCSAVGFCDNQGLRVITAATDASLAGWTCTLSHETKKPLLTKGFFR